MTSIEELLHHLVTDPFYMSLEEIGKLSDEQLLFIYCGVREPKPVEVPSPEYAEKAAEMLLDTLCQLQNLPPKRAEELKKGYREQWKRNRSRNGSQNSIPSSNP